ncbi:MAG: acetyl-CoA carboxylase biotin carboxyl carrier protein [Chitinophagaceae bacterium]|nr:acetyl-CoA carboxylase biotin carboxyl carrier protein [Chitinophagaceae bacterium]
MDFKQIQELIKVINKSNIGEISIEENDFKITIRQKEDPVPMFVAPASVPAYPSYQPAPALPSQIGSSLQLPATGQPTIPPAAENKPADNLITIKSPMIGTFYRSSTPDKPPLVGVGDEVTIGKPVCIIEAMKLFNEIESEVSGKIVKVLVDDASPVEFDQPLFLVDPS